MKPLVIYCSYHKQKREFVPREVGKIGFYACGMTVYDYCHIGHVRTFVAMDIIVRYLRSQNWQVNYVRNITDIDDKIIQRADELKIPYWQLTKQFIEAMDEDFSRLFMLPPNEEPRATGNIEQIIALVEALITRGFAYHADNGDVYFKVMQFAEYGRLSGVQVEELLGGARIEIEQAKQDERDFVLWKNATADEVGWKSPWGWGRPGWHIECSAMSKACLGNHFDIHAGGIDLQFPHHENEIAQSVCANDSPFVNYWLHVGSLQIDGEKMSKSLGNFFTIRDVLEHYRPEVIRYFIANTHYRSPISYSEHNLFEAKQGLERFYHCLQHYSEVKPAQVLELEPSPYYQRFVQAMNDDFNTREALVVMYDLVREINQCNNTQTDVLNINALVAQLKAMGNILGIFETEAQEYWQGSTSDKAISEEEIERLLEERQQLRASGGYQQADEIREYLANLGIQIEDSSKGARWKKV